MHLVNDQHDFKVFRTFPMVWASFFKVLFAINATAINSSELALAFYRYFIVSLGNECDALLVVQRFRQIFF